MEVRCSPLVGPATQALNPTVVGLVLSVVASGVPVMRTAQEHVIDEADSITSLSLSRDSRRAHLLR